MLAKEQTGVDPGRREKSGVARVRHYPVMRCQGYVNETGEPARMAQ